MHQKILNALKAKFVGVSETILARIATKLAQTNTTEEQVTESVEKLTLQQVIDSYADSRATEASQTAVKNYEQKHGLKDGKQAQPTTENQNQGGAQTNPTTNSQTNNNADATPAWAKALIEANKALNERIGKMEGERISANRRQQLSSVVSRLPEQLRKPYDRIAVDGLTDEQFGTLVTEVTTEVEGLTKDLNAKGAVFGRPTATGGQRMKTELTKEQQDTIAHRDNVTTDSSAQPF